MPENIPEVGIVLYPGSQTAAVLGMTDLMTYAEELARGKRESDRRLLRVSHWEWQEEAGEPVRAFDTVPGPRETRPSSSFRPDWVSRCPVSWRRSGLNGSRASMRRAPPLGPSARALSCSARLD
jgi:hypothetical protein